MGCGVNKVSVLFTGLIRDESLFYKSVNLVLNMQKKSVVRDVHAVLWSDELKKHPDACKYLEDNFVKVSFVDSIEQDYLFEAQGGNGIKQLYSIKSGLESFLDEEFVLKTRFDILFSERKFKGIVNTYLKSCEVSSNSEKYKILSPGASVVRPFSFIDWYYLGNVKELKKNLNIDYESLRKIFYRYNKIGLRTSLGAGMWQFVNGFLEENNVVSEYIFLAPFFEKRSPFFKKTMSWAYGNENFLKLVAFYWKVIDQRFIIDQPSGVLFYSKGKVMDNLFYSKKNSIDYFSLSKNIIKKKYFRKKILNTYMYDFSLMNNLELMEDDLSINLCVLMDMSEEELGRASFIQDFVMFLRNEVDSKLADLVMKV